MKRALLSIPVALAFLLVLDGCSNFPEGPGLSVRSKKDRLANEWVIHKVYTNDVDVTSYWLAAYPDYLWEIRKDYYYSLYINTDTISGEWEFDDAKEQLILHEENNPTPDIFDIYKLKYDELWLHQIVGGESTEYHFITKPD